VDAYWEDTDAGITLYLGDCLTVLPTLADASVDSIVTDPPYGLTELAAATVLSAIAAWMAGDRTHVPDGRGFMGREWDRFVPPPGVWDECLRVLKPGGHVLAFAGARTVDLMTLSIRIAGFEIRDSIDWIYGSGFPKSHDVSKAIDKAAGAQREVVGASAHSANRSAGSWQADGRAPTRMAKGNEGERQITAPATADAARWDGWGTALKPAHEPIVLARRPLSGTVVVNVLQHGTGALNIDDCRTVAGQDYRQKCASVVGIDSPRNGDTGGERTGAREDSAHVAGRWPTNVILTHPPLLDDDGQVVGDACADGCVPGCPVAEMDAQSGGSTSAAKGKAGGAFKSTSLYAQDATSRGMARTERPTHGDKGGASRFFTVFRYEAKAPASERPRLADGTAHTTVKPLALMRWLIRLVTPPGGAVLDPFVGSGTTLEAALIEGFPAIGIEREADHAELCVTRLAKPITSTLFGATP